MTFYILKSEVDGPSLSELIGEEIYDEFDPQGARGDPYEVPERDVQPSEKVIPKPEAASPKTAPPSLPIIMPTALRNFGGLGFLRSRSAPPVPRDVDLDPNVDENNQDDGYVEKHGPMTMPDTKIEMPKPAAVAERQAPSIVVEPYDVAPEYSPSPPIEMSPGIGAEGKSKSLPLANTASSPVLSPNLRTASPAPLEAVLLDRKRRLIGAASVAPSAVASTTSLGGVAGPSTPTVIGVAPARNTPSVKGTRFKSSPLGGVVVVEKAKENVDGDVPDEGKN